MPIAQNIKQEFTEMAQGEGYVKIIVSALLGAALGITITFMTGVSSNATEIVRLTTIVQSLTNEVRAGMVDRYRGADARRDFALIQEQIKNVIIHDQELEIEFRDHVAAHNAEHNR
jgi:hypothetical protein